MIDTKYIESHVILWYNLAKELPQRIGGQLPEKGGDNMVTYGDLFALGLLIVAIIALFNNKRK